METAAIIVAAGRGTRAGPGAPKQWRPLAGARVLDHALAALSAHPAVGRVVLVLHPGEMHLAPEGPLVVPGGESRAASVRAGLAALSGRPPEVVLIHDGARPCLPAGVIDRLLMALETGTGAAPALPVTDALWTGAGGHVTGTRDREGLWRAQTPQAFRYANIVLAHAIHGGEAADDVEVARAAGLDVAIVPGDEDNLKITGPGDFARAEAILARRQGDRPMDIRTGNGFDVHRFGPGDHVMLCGVTVPHDRGLQGHSDADVGLHTITDAIYGALAEGDIGRHFPPTDPQWKGAESHIFLRHAAGRAEARGFRVANVDLTLICERPKIGPHAPEMIAKVAEIMGLDPTRVSVKATTSERLGFTGREEGIAALATVTLVSP